MGIKTCASIFSGGGGWDIGARAAGFTPLWGVELDPVAAAAYAANVTPHVINEDVRKVDPFRLPVPDVLFASPPCQPFSKARGASLPKHCDIDLALEVPRFAGALRPKVVVVENVMDFSTSKQYAQMKMKMEQLGYGMVWSEAIEASRFGVPSMRERFISVFVSQGADAYRPLQRERGADWWKAIEDLFPRLPPTKGLAQWQADGLLFFQPLFKGPLYFSGGNSQATIVTAAKTYRKSHVESGRPAPTIVASEKSMAGTRIYANGEVRGMHPRVAARLMTFPDDYRLPAKAAAAYNIMGNAVPPRMAAVIASHIRLPGSES